MHLSIGQESAVVGQASQLDPDDFLFGSHRSHGEILAKCFSAARKLFDGTVLVLSTMIIAVPTFVIGFVMQKRRRR